MKKDNLIILVAFILSCIILLTYFGTKYNKEHKPAQTIEKPIETSPANKSQLSVSQIKKIQDLIDIQNTRLNRIKELEGKIANYKELFKEHKLTNPFEKSLEEEKLQIPEINIPDIKIEELNISNYAQALEDLKSTQLPLSQTVGLLEAQISSYKLILKQEKSKTQTIKPIPYKEGAFGVNQNYIPFIKNLINLAKEKEISQFTDEEIYKAAEPYEIFDIDRIDSSSSPSHIMNLTLQNGDVFYLDKDKIRVPFKDRKNPVIFFYFNGNTSCWAPLPEGYEYCQNIGGTDPISDSYHTSMLTFKLPKNIFDTESL